MLNKQVFLKYRVFRPRFGKYCLLALTGLEFIHFLPEGPGGYLRLFTFTKNDAGIHMLERFSGAQFFKLQGVTQKTVMKSM